MVSSLVPKREVIFPTMKLVALVAIGWFATSGQAFAATGVASVAAATDGEGEKTLDALSFIAGRWIGRSENGMIEEVWTAPEGNAMIGLFRMVGGGEARFYEFQSITLEDDGPVLRIKHFNPDMVGWETKDESTVFTLKSLSGQKAIFDEVDAEVPTTLHFEREGDELVIILRKIRDGEPRDSRFAFQREPF